MVAAVTTPPRAKINRDQRMSSKTVQHAFGKIPLDKKRFIADGSINNPARVLTETKKTVTQTSWLPDKVIGNNQHVDQATYRY